MNVLSDLPLGADNLVE